MFQRLLRMTLLKNSRAEPDRVNPGIANVTPSTRACGSGSMQRRFLPYENTLLISLMLGSSASTTRSPETVVSNMVSGPQDLLGTAGGVGYQSDRVETHTASPDKVTGTNAVLALSSRSPSSLLLFWCPRPIASSSGGLTPPPLPEPADRRGGGGGCPVVGVPKPKKMLCLDPSHRGLYHQKK